MPPKRGKGEEPAAVFSLKLDSPEAEPREVQAGGDGGDGFQTPCTISGAMAGLSGGALGYVFGFGERAPPPGGRLGRCRWHPGA